MVFSYRQPARQLETLLLATTSRHRTWLDLNKQTFWRIRANVVRKLDRGEPEQETIILKRALALEQRLPCS
jgi:hypothetical protein